MYNMSHECAYGFVGSHFVDMHLTNSGRGTHISVAELNIIGPDNGLSPGRRQAIIWTNDGILLIGLLEINFSEILIEMHPFHSRHSSVKWRSLCLSPMC